MMYHGKHERPRKKRRTRGSLPLLISLLLILALAVGGTVAWLVTRTDAVENTMVPGEVPISINEFFDGRTKKDVSVTNNGNVNAYVRVAIVANAVDENGNVIAGTAPGYTVNTANWQPLDGYYYYKGIVGPGEKTAELFAGNVTVTGGEVNILAESIQVEGGYNGQKPETYAWSVEYSDSTPLEPWSIKEGA